MNRTRGLILLLSALLPFVVQAQTGRIRTLGEGRVMVAPDTGEVSFTVRAEDRQLAPAREQAAAQMTRLLEALRGLRLQGLTLGTASLNVTPVVRQVQRGPNVDPNVEVQQQIVGYRVTNTVSARLKGDRDALAAGLARIMDTVTTGGAANFSGPSFYRQDLTEANRQALEEATRDAVSKAQALARAAGLTIGKISYVGMYPEENPQNPPMPMMARAMYAEAGGGTPTPVEVRDVEVTAQVWVTATY